jgi:predicted anti-sigma-YlaC factor YlaD
MSLHLDGLLSSEEKVTLESHLARCTTCWEHWQDWQHIDRRLREAPLATAPGDFVPEVMRRISRYQVFPVPAVRVPGWAILGASALAVVSFAAWVIFAAISVYWQMDTVWYLGLCALKSAGVALSVVDALTLTGRTLLSKLLAPTTVAGLVSLSGLSVLVLVIWLRLVTKYSTWRRVA